MTAAIETPPEAAKVTRWGRGLREVYIVHER